MFLQFHKNFIIFVQVRYITIDTKEVLDITIFFLHVNYNTKDECKVCQNVIKMNGQ